MNFEVSIFKAHIPATQSFNSFQPKLLDTNGFPVPFDMKKVKKKDLFIGTFMPSTELSGA